MMVFLVGLQMFSKESDSLGEDSNLYFRRSGVAFVDCIGVNDFFFASAVNIIASYKNINCCIQVYAGVAINWGTVQPRVIIHEQTIDCKTFIQEELYRSWRRRFPQISSADRRW